MSSQHFLISDRLQIFLYPMKYFQLTEIFSTPDMKYFSWWDIILSRTEMGAAQAAADRDYLGAI